MNVDQWLTPDGVMVAVLIFTTLLGFAKAVAERMGKTEAVAKLHATTEVLNKSTNTLGAIVGVVGKVRRDKNLDPATVAALIGQIKSTTYDVGVDKILDTIVQETKKDPTTLGAMVAAKDALKPEVVKPTVVQKLTGRIS